MSEPEVFDPRGLLAALDRNYVGYVLIGGLARVTETTAGGSVYTFRLSVGCGGRAVVSRCCAAAA